MKKLKHKLEILEEKLQQHDWYYQYSDDHRVWKRGSEQSKVIQNLIKELQELGYGDQAEKLFHKYLNDK
jgi:tRNA G26 N,N-dimethylase Trm1